MSPIPSNSEQCRIYGRSTAKCFWFVPKCYEEHVKRQNRNVTPTRSHSGNTRFMLTRMLGVFIFLISLKNYLPMEIICEALFVLFIHLRMFMSRLKNTLKCCQFI